MIIKSYIKNLMLRLKAKKKSIIIDKTARVSSINNWGNNIKIYEKCKIINCIIDNFTYIAPETSIANCKIGKFCSIGPNVTIAPGKHPVNFVSTSPVFFSVGKQAGVTFSDKNFYTENEDVLIGNDVWIGANCVILDGVKIGDGAIIAAGAIVNCDVENYSIVGGVPAKFIKYRFEKNIIEKLNYLKWWNNEEQWIKENYSTFNNIEDFAKKYLSEN